MTLEDITKGQLVCIRSDPEYGASPSFTFETVSSITKQYIKVHDNGYWFSRKTGHFCGIRVGGGKLCIDLAHEKTCPSPSLLALQTDAPNAKV